MPVDLPVYLKQPPQAGPAPRRHDLFGPGLEKEPGGRLAHLHVRIAVVPGIVQELHDPEHVEPAPEALPEGTGGSAVAADLHQGAGKLLGTQKIPQHTGLVTQDGTGQGFAAKPAQE